MRLIGLNQSLFLALRASTVTNHASTVMQQSITKLAIVSRHLQRTTLVIDRTGIIIPPAQFAFELAASETDEIQRIRLEKGMDHIPNLYVSGVNLEQDSAVTGATFQNIIAVVSQSVPRIKSLANSTTTIEVTPLLTVHSRMKLNHQKSASKLYNCVI